MWSKFYQTHSRKLMWFLLITFPILYIESNSMPSNNDIETWLPDNQEVREDYNRFKLDFGAEEIIIVALPTELEQSGLVDSLATRITELSGVSECYSPRQLANAMTEMQIAPEEIDHRLRGLCRSKDGTMLALMTILSAEGTSNRAQLVEDLRGELAYCQLDDTEYHLAGAPIIVTELDRLGGKDEASKFFMLTMLISLFLLYYTLKDWKLTFGLLGQTLWAIELSGAIIKWSGGEANFILGALSIMVMVFTLAASIHVTHYYRHCHGDDRLDRALKMAWKPCFLAMLTTAIGLASLMVSEMAPVRQFGFGAALGAIVSLLVGFGVTPAMLTLYPLPKEVGQGNDYRLSRFAFWVVDHSRSVVVATLILIIACGIGLKTLNSRINALDFLPQDGKVIQDTKLLEEKFASTSSIEAVVDFGGLEMPFADKLSHIQNVCSTLEDHPSIEYAVSAATFLPTQLPTDPFEAAALLNRAQQSHGDSDFISRGERLWRISARFSENIEQSDRQTINELITATESEIPIRFTGMEILLEHAQKQIFTGFWESFATAFLIITTVMVISLRSLKAGLIAMIPNLTPVCIVFGLLGWFGVPVEIGTMMTGSIALGLAVDGTFHYLVRYKDACQSGDCSTKAARRALLLTGGAILNASVITAVGMTALGLSSFAPTARFGFMMTALMLAAVVGDLILLPALLSLKEQRRGINKEAEIDLRGPHAPMHAPSKTHSESARELRRKAG